MRRRIWAIAAGLACAANLGAADSALADKIKHPIAVFSGLDKITGRIISFEAAINETVQFGSLQITPRVCYTRPPTEAPRTDVFAEVDEVEQNRSYKRIFSGWMFADSPGMHGIEHPIYDIWLTDCKGGSEVIHEAPAAAEAATPEGADSAPPGSPDAKPSPTPTPTPKKQRKPKSNAAVIESSPLDLGGPANPDAPAPRNPPTRRFFPAESAPVPPANVGQ